MKRALLALACAVRLQAAEPEARILVDVRPEAVNAQAPDPGARITLVLSGPRGEVERRTGEGQVSVPTAGDGEYTFSVQLHGALAAASEDGAFVIRAGQVVKPGDGRAGAEPARVPDVPADFVVDDFLIAQGFGCIGGSACDENETPQGRVLKLKDTVPVLSFDDTSTLPGLPSNDWRLRGNEPLNQFSLLDVTAGRIPFTLRPRDLNGYGIQVGEDGRVGLGTDDPHDTLSVVSPSGQALSLEASGVGHTWRLRTHETTGLALEHTAAGSPDDPPLLQLRPSPQGGQLGLGTASPQAPLHVRRGDGTARVLVEETNAQVIGRNLLRLANNGPSTFRFDNSATGGSWGFGSLNTGDFFIAASGVPALAAALTPAGVLTVAEVVQTSDRDAKQDIAALDPRDVLERALALPFATWRLEPGLGDGATHIGPMAQDFAAAFGLGADDRHVQAADLAGIALAAVQGAAELHDAADARAALLRARADTLGAGLARLEAGETLPSLTVERRPDALRARTSAGGRTRLTLTVSGPRGVVLWQAGESSELSVALVDAQGVPLGDGAYTWEARLTALEGANRESVDACAGRPGRCGLLRETSGAFVVLGGALAPSRESTPTAPPAGGDSLIVHENLIVQGAACFGSAACEDGESFAGDMLRLKAGVPALRFEDSSSLPGESQRDWLLRGNEPLDQFSLLDLTAGTVPFTVRAGAPNHSIYLDPAGRLGLGTSTPAEAVSVVRPDAPRLSLEATASSERWTLGPTAAGDAFTVEAQAPLGLGAPSAVELLRVASAASGGGVGLGVVPQAPLHVRRSDGSGRVLVEETNATVIGRNLLRLANNGPSTFRFDNSATGGSWGFGSLNSGSFFIAGGGAPALAATLTPAGVLTVSQLVQTSDRARKVEVQPVDDVELLERVVGLPVARWRFKPGRGDAGWHVGPMAQDFAARFGFGADERLIAPSDVAAVALGALRGLRERLAEREGELAALEREQAELQERLERLAR